MENEYEDYIPSAEFLMVSPLLTFLWSFVVPLWSGVNKDDGRECLENEAEVALP